jgi:serine phosphatase RsbU (regulator of sigma subunit)
MKFLINLLFFFFIVNQLFSQTKLIDSLENVLKKTPDGVKKIDVYSKLGSEYLYDNIDKLLSLSNEMMQLSIKLNNEKGIGASNNLLGNYYYFKGNYSLALEYFQKNISYYIKTKNNISLGNNYLSLGNVYESLGEADKAIYYYLKSLKIDEELGDKQRLSDDFTNLGVFYNHRKNHKKALTYFLKALKLDVELKNDQFIVGTYTNLSSVYFALNDLEKAKFYSIKGYNKAIETNNLDALGRLSNNLSELFFQTKEYKKSLYYNLKSLKIKENLDQKEGLTNAFLNTGLVYEKLGNDENALNYFVKSYDLSKKIKHTEGVVDICKVLSRYFENKNNLEKSLRYFKEYSNLKDTLFNIQSEGKITEMSTKYESEKKESQILLLKKDKILNKEVAERQKTIIYSTIIGLLIVLFFLILLYKRFKITQKQKAIIEIQKKEVEDAHQHLEKKNREILDSITYAKRIQSAILPQAKLVKEFLQESFILYKPKDIVAGDFYWLEVVGDVVLFAAADCTGHGVPGAMVSVVCNNGLNRAVREFGLTNPSLILDKTRELVIQEFEKSDDNVKDGMDISLCALNTKTNILQWTGANNPLWILRKNDDGEHEQFNEQAVSLVEFKADKQPIGNYLNQKPFTNHEIVLKQNDEIYIFTDGYQDQFGGTLNGKAGKKFKIAQFRTLLLSLNQLNMDEKKVKINETFETWKGELEQVDDVCVSGVRI